jgi:hypothetical protein
LTDVKINHTFVLPKQNEMIKETITVENIFEVMASMTKSKLIEKGVLPSDANDLAIEFVKERGMQIINNVVKDNK